MENLTQNQLVEEGLKLWKALPPNSPDRMKHGLVIAEALHAQYHKTSEYDFNSDALLMLQDLFQFVGQADHEQSAGFADLCARCFLAQGTEFSSEKDLEEAVGCAEASIGHTRKLDGDAARELLISRKTTLVSCLYAQATLVSQDPIDVLRTTLRAAQDAELLISSITSADVASNVFKTKAMAALSLFDLLNEWSYLEMSMKANSQRLSYIDEHDLDELHDCKATRAFYLQRAYRFRCEQDPAVSLDQTEEYGTKAVNMMLEAFKIRPRRLLALLENSMTFVLYIQKLPRPLQSGFLGKCSTFLEEAVHLTVDIALMSIHDDRRKLLLSMYGISRYAAAARLAAGSGPYEALAILEEGRGIATSFQGDELDGVMEVTPPQPHEALSSEDSALSSRLADAKMRLYRSSMQDELYSTRRQLYDDYCEARQQCVVRGLHPRTFLSKEDCKQLCRSHDIVVISITDIKSDAIVMSKGCIKSISLPHLSENDVATSSWKIQQALANDNLQSSQYAILWKDLTAMLKKLWSRVAEPVLNDLGHRVAYEDVRRAPRVQWILTGVLALYPIHAAGLGMHTNKNVCNRVVSSYSSSVRTFSRLLDEHQATSLDEQTVAIVAMRKTPDWPDLDLVDAEIEVVRSRFASVECADQPSSEQVLTILARDEIKRILFSCHGDTNFDNPFKSTLLLQDWKTAPLTVDLIKQSNPVRGRKAFLSACFTANSGVEGEQDEGVNIVAALQLAGFEGIVGALWRVDERSALETLRKFYEYLKQSDDDAVALHEAVIDLANASRSAGNQDKGDPILWAAFVYNGI
nr:hypothetical protein B0A51_02585 [Rachicladosporium sp. CCFEE 5018]